MRRIGLILMSLLYIAAGINHFLNPKFYLRIIPPFLPMPKLINQLSGVAEIALGALLLVPRVSTVAAKGIIVLLIAVFPANVYHLYAKGAGMKIPTWALWLRLPMQWVLIRWARVYARGS